MSKVLVTFEPIEVELRKNEEINQSFLIDVKILVGCKYCYCNKDVLKQLVVKDIVAVKKKK